VHNVKASDLVSLRRSLADTQPGTLEQVRSQMPVALRTTLDATVASAWLPCTEICAIYGYFCRALFPGASSPYVALGRHMALLAYRGVYRVFLAIPSTSFVIGKAANVWSSYHSTGAATVEDVHPRGAVLVVRGADAIDKEMIDIVTGHIHALAELTGAKDPVVASSADQPAALRWSIRWK
jgi:hypothetical protein